MPANLAEESLEEEHPFGMVAPSFVEKELPLSVLHLFNRSGVGVGNGSIYLSREYLGVGME